MGVGVSPHQVCLGFGYFSISKSVSTAGRKDFAPHTSWTSGKVGEASKQREKRSDLTWSSNITMEIYGKWAIYNWLTYQKRIILNSYASLPEVMLNCLLVHVGWSECGVCSCLWHCLAMLLWWKTHQFFWAQKNPLNPLRDVEFGHLIWSGKSREMSWLGFNTYLFRILLVA